MRGNRGRRIPRHLPRRSIPARAGEPEGGKNSTKSRGVYPRTCGGTRPRPARRHAVQGLSPHVRGNRAGHHPCQLRVGSIPARAGEPSRCRATPATWWVYPRTCGGTVAASRPTMSPVGLSPHVRGNRARSGTSTRPCGSIPARAGEPPAQPAALRASQVYPRTCGGTSTPPAAPWSSLGLSPHVRGNLSGRHFHPPRLGSIPARAGEPACTRSRIDGHWVYPRTCGGTAGDVSVGQIDTGLSPHVRGNLVGSDTLSPSSRSIPARAGEPPGPGRSRPRPRVYPRTCGGTWVWV